MIETFCVLLLIILASRIVEELAAIPSPLTILLLAFAVANALPGFLAISPGDFDQILLLMLPIILLPEVLGMSLEEIRKNFRVLFFLAVVAVGLSILIAVAVTPRLLPAHGLGPAALFALYAMLMATDAVTVASIFGRIRLPDTLKLYAEGESLFNDVTALVLFYFVALPLIGGQDVALSMINLILVKVLFLSVGIGVGTSGVGYFAIKVLKDPIEQFIVIYLVAILSFIAAERLHISGILAIIASVISLRILIDRELRAREARSLAAPAGTEGGLLPALLRVISTAPAMTRRGLRAYRKEATYVAIFGNALLFVSLASIVRIDLLLRYQREIAVVFLVTTATRLLVVGSMHLIFRTPWHWTALLGLAGAKGGLTLIMAHSLPAGFAFREMFVSIVMGVVLLSTFVYTIGLVALLRLFRGRIREERAVRETVSDGAPDLQGALRDVLEKDPVTGAYQQALLEDFVAREVSRATRYKTDLSLIGLDVGAAAAAAEPGAPRQDFLALLGRAVLGKIRVNDSFCRAGGGRFVVVVANTSAAGAVALAQHLERQVAALLPRAGIDAVSFGVAEFSEGDTFEILMEKVDSALQRARAQGGGVGLET